MVYSYGSWKNSWETCVDDISSDWDYQTSAQKLRDLIGEGLLRFRDLHDNPERFFEAHRLLVDPIKRGPGFWIRFTVQYNLFAGTVLGLGTPEQVDILDEMQEKQQLGCFGLTERFAGVNSGLIVNTTATWDNSKQMFLLHSPDQGSFKNWISQGLTADKCVVIACLIVNGTNHGPHGFLIDFRKNGKLADNIVLGDMGRKTTGNDLDNAWIQFNHMYIPYESLLRRYADIRDNKYVQTTKEKLRIEIIGQRLLTGRVAVGQAAVEFTRKLYAATKAYSDKKLCWSPKSTPALSQIPQLNALYEKADSQLKRLDKYMSIIEKKLCELLRNDGVVPPSLVLSIMVGKIMCVETAISLCFSLKQEVGSYALMGDTGFEHMDFLQACKFAEGDSRILMQKLARDRVRTYERESAQKCVSGSHLENFICKKLSNDGKSKWDDNFESVYALATSVCEGTIGVVLGEPFSSKL